MSRRANWGRCPCVLDFESERHHMSFISYFDRRALLFASSAILISSSAIKADTIVAYGYFADNTSCSIDSGIAGPPGTAYQSVTSGTASASANCTYSNGSTGTFSATSSIGALGGSVSFTGPDSGYTSSYYVEQVTFDGVASPDCPGGNGVVECYGGANANDPSAGTPLEAAFYFTQNGTPSGDSSSVQATLQVEVNGTQYMDATGTGTLVSNPYTFDTGVPLTLSVSFTLDVGCSNNGCSADFSDPDLTNVIITDPSTGLPVLGITAMGDNGAALPTDVGIAGPLSSVPEPSSFAMLATAAIGTLLARKRRYRSP